MTEEVWIRGQLAGGPKPMRLLHTAANNVGCPFKWAKLRSKVWEMIEDEKLALTPDWEIRDNLPS